MANLGKRFAWGMISLAGYLGLSVSPIVAQTFPSEPITLVVNWPAGGGMDRAGRLLAEHAPKYLGTSVAVINVDGAGGAAGVRHVADADPDGYTIGILGASIVASQYSNPSANAIDDVDYLAFFGPDPMALEVRADTGITSVGEYIEAVRADPGALRNGNDAPGGVSNSAASFLEQRLGVSIVKVPYQGFAPTVAALLSDEVQSATLPVHQFVDHYENGDVNILAVMSTERHFMTPDVPTFEELGYDLVSGDWRAIYVPLDVPDDRKAFLEDAFLQTLNDPEFLEGAEQLGFVITPMDAAETTAYVEQADEALYPLLQEAGLVRTREK